VLCHPFLDQIDAALQELFPEQRVDVRGEWRSRPRRVYKSADQLGSGSGPYVEVVDHVWEGELTSIDPFTGMVFLLSGTGVYWAKAAHVSCTLPVRVSLHAYAGYDGDGVMFFANVGGAGAPSVTVSASTEAPRGILVAPSIIPMGRVVCLARADETAFFVVLIQGRFVKFGRNRLWRLRETLASRVPDDVRELMTRCRAGTFPIQHGS
jgi:hypothetical protein